jgi:hypothetical protein
MSHMQKRPLHVSQNGPNKHWICRDVFGDAIQQPVDWYADMYSPCGSRQVDTSERADVGCRDILIHACSVGSDVKSLRDFQAVDEEADAMAEAAHNLPMKPTTVLVPGRNKMRVTLLPPPTSNARANPLTTVDIAKAADVVLLCMAIVAAPEPAGKGGVAAALDTEASLALQVLRSMGMLPVLVVTQGGGCSLKERAACKKAAATAIASELPGDHKVSR